MQCLREAAGNLHSRRNEEQTGDVRQVSVGHCVKRQWCHRAAFPFRLNDSTRALAAPLPLPPLCIRAEAAGTTHGAQPLMSDASIMRLGDAAATARLPRRRAAVGGGDQQPQAAQACKQQPTTRASKGREGGQHKRAAEVCHAVHMPQNYWKRNIMNWFLVWFGSVKL